MRPIPGPVIVLLSALAITGCQSPPSTASNPFEIDAREYSRMFDAAVIVLRDHGFRVDRQDHRFGIITTAARDVPTPVEPWQPNQGEPTRAIEHLLNHQRHTVTIRLTPGVPDRAADAVPDAAASTDVATTMSPPQDGGGVAAAVASDGAAGASYGMAVRVDLWRAQRPVAQLSGSTAGYAVLSALRELPDTEFSREPAMQWRRIGRDERLEQALLAAIVRRSFAVHRDGR
jgi:hypothetical protein